MNEKKQAYVSPKMKVVETRVRKVLCVSNYPAAASEYDEGDTLDM